jgi:P27 family predicted phage terminase small subunit
VRPGRKKTTRSLVLVRGNPGKRPIPEESPEVERFTECPEPPAWLEEYAKQEWRERGAQLCKMGILDRSNVVCFEAYCQSYARWRQAEEFLTAQRTSVMALKDPDGKIKYLQALPQVSISNQERKQLRSFACEFGLTPNALSSLHVDKNELSPEEELERLISS